MIQFKDVTKDFKGNVVLSNISMDINDGELTVLIGPSGCGKTTTLKMINRLIPTSSGNIFIDDKNIDSMDPVALRRNIGYVIQQGGLFPHMTIKENIEIIEKLSGKPTEEIVKNTERLMRMVDLDPDEFLNRYPTELSGGQQQRIGVIRALANDPEIILLDEPLSALDLKLRTEMQYELRELQQRLGKTFVFVTHDQEEALAMSDEIFVLNQGTIQQSGSPVDIYDEPINRFVADFIGESNIVEGTMERDFEVSFIGKTFECVDQGLNPHEKVDVVIRPEDLEITTVEHGKITVTVDTQLFRGVHYELSTYDDNGNEWLIHSLKKADVGAKIGLDFEPDAIHIMRLNETEEEFDARLESYGDEEHAK